MSLQTKDIMYCPAVILDGRDICSKFSPFPLKEFINKTTTFFHSNYKDIFQCFLLSADYISI